MKLKTVFFSNLILFSALVLFSNCGHSSDKGKTPDTSKAVNKTTTTSTTVKTVDSVTTKVVYPPIDKKLYDSLMKRLAHGDTTGRWPVKNTPYPLPGAILPFKRVVAYYGNLYSKK